MKMRIGTRQVDKQEHQRPVLRRPRLSPLKKSNKDDSDFDSEEEVNNDPSFLIAENARFNDLLDYRDDVLKKTNKDKREYTSLLGEAKEKVVELEFLLVMLVLK
jgi:hypothetical protein